MLILAIDTSCDETSVAITWNDVILSNVISSQVELHKGYGGVVPTIAMRAHKERIDAVIEETIKRANVQIKKVCHSVFDTESKNKKKKEKNLLSSRVEPGGAWPASTQSNRGERSRSGAQTEIASESLAMTDSFFGFLDSRWSLSRPERRGGNDNKVVLRQAQDDKLSLKNINLFAVTYGPGLAPALQVGVEKTKELTRQYKKPLVAVDHMEGHIYANFVRKSKVQSPKSKTKPSTLNPKLFPLLCLLISGGHTELVLMKSHGKYKIIGETLDDAVGEAFDKVAKMLNLGYPGGPIVESLAREGNPFKYQFPTPLEKSKDCDFSYSGLKTSVLYTLQKISPKGRFTKKQVCDVCASFQRAAVEHLVQKTVRAVKQLRVTRYASPVTRLLLGGGVVANKLVRSELCKAMKPCGVQVVYPTDKKLLGDNAAMIAIAAFYKAKRKGFVKNISKLDRNPGLKIGYPTKS